MLIWNELSLCIAIPVASDMQLICLTVENANGSSSSPGYKWDLKDGGSQLLQTGALGCCFHRMFAGGWDLRGTSEETGELT